MLTRLVDIYKHQRDFEVDGNIYKATQCDFAYNSNKIEGSQLTHEQTVLLFDRDYVVDARREDVVETGNHFTCFDYMLDHTDEPLTEELIKHMHALLMAGTRKAANPAYSVGEYKQFENIIVRNGVSDFKTTRPEEVADAIGHTIGVYEESEKSFDSILAFHVAFEQIHPFSDGNGRIGRLLMFRECLREDITPFVITDDLCAFYLRGLDMWDKEQGWLRDTCLTAQDRFEAKYMPMAQSYAEAVNRSGSQVLNALVADCNQAASQQENGQAPQQEKTFTHNVDTR